MAWSTEPKLCSQILTWAASVWPDVTLLEDKPLPGPEPRRSSRAALESRLQNFLAGNGMPYTEPGSEEFARLLFSIDSQASPDIRRMIRLSVGHRSSSPDCLATLAIAIWPENITALQILTLTSRGELQNLASELLLKKDGNNGGSLFLIAARKLMDDPKADITEQLMRASNQPTWVFYPVELPVIPNDTEVTSFGWQINREQLLSSLLEATPIDEFKLQLGTRISQAVLRGPHATLSDDEAMSWAVAGLRCGIRLTDSPQADLVQFVTGLGLIRRCGEFLESEGMLAQISENFSEEKWRDWRKTLQIFTSEYAPVFFGKRQKISKFYQASPGLLQLPLHEQEIAILNQLRKDVKLEQYGLD